MKGFLIGISAAASLLGTGAFAADLPTKAPPVYTKVPVYDPIYDWTGFYVGGNIGYSWGNSNSTLSLIDPGSGTTLTSTGTKLVWTASSAAAKSDTTGRGTDGCLASRPTSRAQDKPAMEALYASAALLPC